MSHRPSGINADVESTVGEVAATLARNESQSQGRRLPVPDLVRERLANPRLPFLSARRGALGV
jgi:hypothetical protein